jgi:hypothetical protein
VHPPAELLLVETPGSRAAEDRNEVKQENQMKGRRSLRQEARSHVIRVSNVDVSSCRERTPCELGKEKNQGEHSQRRAAPPRMPLRDRGHKSVTFKTETGENMISKNNCACRSSNANERWRPGHKRAPSQPPLRWNG